MFCADSAMSRVPKPLMGQFDDCPSSFLGIKRHHDLTICLSVYRSKNDDKESCAVPDLSVKMVIATVRCDGGSEMFVLIRYEGLLNSLLPRQLLYATSLV